MASCCSLDVMGVELLWLRVWARFASGSPPLFFVELLRTTPGRATLGWLLWSSVTTLDGLLSCRGQHKVSRLRLSLDGPPHVTRGRCQVWRPPRRYSEAHFGFICELFGAMRSAGSFPDVGALLGA